MSGFLISVVSVGVILGFMILIHEFGHYAVAKLLGVRVEQFAIGFGKRLVGFRKGETDYRLNAIPLGGYVKMSGENPMDERTGDPREFMSHPRWHRFLIAIAGPFMNIALSIVLLAAVYMVGYQYPVFSDQPIKISAIKPDSAAAKIGLQPGDLITKLGSIENPTWEVEQSEIAMNPNLPVKISVQRGDQSFEKIITPDLNKTTHMGSAGWYPNETVIVDQITSGMPAEKAGIKEGDKLVAIDGKALPSIEILIETLQQTKDQPIKLHVLRAGNALDFSLSPVLADTEEVGEKKYRIGFAAGYEMKYGRMGLKEAIQESLSENKKNSMLILDLVKKLVQHKVSLKTVEGPIGIGRAAGEAASKKGWTPLLMLTVAISLNLGIFNLLPIPILDGGVILLLFVESLMRRDISLPVKERIYQVAFVFLILFAGMVIFNDLSKTLPGLMHKLP